MNHVLDVVQRPFVMTCDSGHRALVSQLVRVAVVRKQILGTAARQKLGSMKKFLRALSVFLLPLGMAMRNIHIPIVFSG